MLLCGRVFLRLPMLTVNSRKIKFTLRKSLMNIEERREVVGSLVKGSMDWEAEVPPLRGEHSKPHLVPKQMDTAEKLCSIEQDKINENKSE